jgi:hypothetical protein
VDRCPRRWNSSKAKLITLACPPCATAPFHPAGLVRTSGNAAKLNHAKASVSPTTNRPRRSARPTWVSANLKRPFVS